MMPVLFAPDAVDFRSNGIGTLSNALSCVVKEQRNGAYELELQYPVDGAHFSEIGIRSIIKAIPSPYRSAQPFVVYYISKSINGIAKIKAEHISYRLNKAVLLPCNATGVQNAVRALGNSVPTGEFSFESDIVNATSVMRLEKPVSVRSAIGGVNGSFIDTFGGEIEWDNFNVAIKKSRGTNKNVTIRYGKNMTALNYNADNTAARSGVVGFWAGNVNNQQTVVVGNLVTVDDTKGYAEYEPLDLTAEFQTTPTAAQIDQKAKEYVDANLKVDPTVSIDVSFINLAQTLEFKDYALLEQCDLCDTVNVYHTAMGVSSTAKIVEIQTNVLTGKYISIKVGTIKKNIADTIANLLKGVS